VRLCTHLTGRADIAEDLAQEALAEAWRQRHKLTQFDGQAAWLAAVARNICRRYRAREGRELAFSARAAVDPVEATEACNGAERHDAADLELTLEREEVAELLDRALALLPDVTRRAILCHYVDDLSQREVAARLGISEGAVAVRVHRGKLALRRVLSQDALFTQGVCRWRRGADAWETTRLWCTECGTHRLLGRMSGDPMVLALRCSGACSGPGLMQTECEIPGGVPAGAFGRAASRVRTLMDRHYGLNRREEEPRCEGCGRPTALCVGPGNDLPAEVRTPGIHVYLWCYACRAVSHSSLEGAVLALPEGQRFVRRHPRVRAMPPRELEIGGLPALAARFESRGEGAALDVLIRRQDFRVIAIHGAPSS
jgi:RNA polymerase sigma-70 factor (ECF subfamily)